MSSDLKTRKTENVKTIYSPNEVTARPQAPPKRPRLIYINPSDSNVANLIHSKNQKLKTKGHAHD
jgi:hypothetical protein